jgi:L-fuculokinase
MEKKVVLVLDCGATNVRTVAVDETGTLVAKSSVPNSTESDPEFPEYKIWDSDGIWNKLCKTCRDVMQRITASSVAGITVTAFGVDGAPVLRSGKQLYPVISWACQRTAPIMDRIDDYISFNDLYTLSGVHKFSFNTINKFIWLKKNRPDALEKCDFFAFLPSILLHHLSGEWGTDVTMAGTSMLTDLKLRGFSGRILDAIGCGHVDFPALVEAGNIIGTVTSKASKETGIPQKVPVINSGHDTQFALIGSGAEENQPVLSSGTWEVLMSRTREARTDKSSSEYGITIEWDAIPGVYDAGMQWLGSGILEWVRKQFYGLENSRMDKDNVYSRMIEEAMECSPGNIRLSIDFLNEKGSINGLGLSAKREQIYRAAIHALAEKTGESVRILEENGNFRADTLIVVGGGSKNPLWNKLRANATGIPVKIVNFDETTVLGAAVFAFLGAGVYPSFREARTALACKTTTILPD